jgi:hypothetical protein
MQKGERKLKIADSSMEVYQISPHFALKTSEKRSSRPVLTKYKPSQ